MTFRTRSCTFVGILFLCVFAAFFYIFFESGVQETPDSSGYYYIFDRTLSFTQMERPPLFPLYLSFFSLFENIHESILYRLSNYLLNAGGLLLFAWMLYEHTQSKIFSFCGTFFYFFCYHMFSFSNYLNPEILFNFLLTAHLFSMTLYFKKQNNHALLLVSATATVLTFTKPVFLYFPVFTILFLMAVSHTSKKFFDKKKIVISFALFYALPVLLWSYTNKQIFNVYAFSVTEKINIVGKIIQYDLIDSTSDQYFDPLKNALHQPGSLEDDSIYSKLDGIFAATPPGMSPYTYMHQYALSVIRHSFPRYLYRSLSESFLVATDYEQQTPLQSAHTPAFNFYYFVYTVLYLHTLRTIGPWLFVVALVGICIFTLNTNKSVTAASLWYITGMYIFSIGILSLSAYSQYLRLRSPFEQVFLLHCIVGAHHITSKAASLIAHKRMFMLRK